MELIKSNMDISTLSEIAQSQFVWALLCIGLTFFVIKKIYEKNEKQESRLIAIQEKYHDESKEREKKLMEHVERSDQAQERTAIAVEGINRSVSRLEIRVERIERKHKNNEDEGE